MNIPVVNLRAIKRKNKTAYILDYMLNGKRIREVIAHDKRSADIIRAQRQNELTLGIHGIRPPNSRIVSLKDLITKYLNSKEGTVRGTSFKRYQNYFTVFEKFMYQFFPDACEDISRIESRYLQECFKLLTTEKVTKKKSWHPNTVNILRDLLVEMFNTAIDDKYITKNPVSSTKQLDAPQKDNLKFYSKEQLNAIIKNLPTEWQPFITFLAYTGLRKGELINLIWDNVSLNEKNPYLRITTTDSFRPKGGKTQTIRLTKQAVEILTQQKDKDPKYVFVSKSGKKLRKSSPNEALTRVLKKLGITGTIHMLRHTFASNFLMDRVGNLNDLSNYLSHASTDTTKIYAHLSEDYQSDVVKKLENSQERY